MNGIFETNEATLASRHIGETNSHFVLVCCVYLVSARSDTQKS